MPLQHRLRAGRREARRQRVKQPPLAAVPLVDQRFVVGRVGVGILQHRLRCVPVHANLADDRAHPASLRFTEQRRGRAAVRRAEDRGQRRAVGVKLRDQPPRRVLRDRIVGESRLGRKRVTVQPADQLLAITADDIELRKMQVRIDEPRQDQSLAKVHHARLGVLGDHLPRIPQRRHTPRLIHNQPTPRNRPQARPRIRRGERIANHMPNLAAINGRGGGWIQRSLLPREVRHLPRKQSAKNGGRKQVKAEWKDGARGKITVVIERKRN